MSYYQSLLEDYQDGFDSRYSPDRVLCLTCLWEVRYQESKEFWQGNDEYLGDVDCPECGKCTLEEYDDL